MMVASDEIFDRTLVKVIVPANPLRSIVSESLLLPATHSPVVAPEEVLVLAAMIASRKAHNPSVPFATSEVLLTVIVLPAGGVIAPFFGAGELIAKPLNEGGGPFFADVDCHCGNRERNAPKAIQIDARHRTRLRE